MYVYRIVQNKARTAELSGTGAFRYGGRWNSKGTYMLYTSENSSLAYLEALVHFDKTLLPPQLYIVQLEVNDVLRIYALPDKNYGANWKKLALLENQESGDHLMKEKKYIGIKLRSAINTLEHNYLLNPLFPGYNSHIKVISVTEIEVDARLV